MKDLNLRWLRNQIGIVSQEPVLLDMTIRENITYPGRNITAREVIEAAKMADIHDFIISLPKVEVS